jgi:hypothetical protein
MGGRSADQVSHAINNWRANRGMARSIQRFYLLILLGAIVSIAVPVFLRVLLRSDRATQEDFAVYYFLGDELRHGVNPYTTYFTNQAHLDGLNIHGITHGTDPPTFLALIFDPLSRLSLRTAYRIWQLVNLVCLSAAILLLIGPSSGLTSRTGFILAALTVLYPPVVSHIWFSQSKFPVLLLLVLMMRSLRRQRVSYAGFALAAASLLRIFPLAMGGYLLLQQRWRVVGYTMLGILVGSAATFALIGLQNCVSFVTAAWLLVNDSAADIQRDISASLFVTRELHSILPHSAQIFEAIDRASIIGVDILILLATTFATLASPAKQDPDFRIFSLWIATSIFLLPVAWDYDLTLMLIPFAQLAVVASRGEASRRAIAMAVVSYLLLMWWEYVALSGDECGFLSMLTAYLSAYWLATDRPEAVNVPLLSAPYEIWRRLVCAG